MDLSPASMASKNSAFIETDESKKAPEPKDKTFESNANSIGASELAATGELPLPSQAGKDRPLMDFETNASFARNKGAQAQQNAASQQKCSACGATSRSGHCRGAICVTNSKISGCARCSEMHRRKPQSTYRRQKAANSYRGKHYQPRDLVGECPGHTARPLPEDRGRFNWIPLVYVRGAEARFDQYRDASGYDLLSSEADE